jgi:long-chain acyl-CoA synthetase
MLNVYHAGLAVGLGPHRIYLHQTPMFHAASMSGILGIPALGGVSVFVPLFKPDRVIEVIEQYKVNLTVMVPTMIAMMLNDPNFSPERLASLTTLVYGASPMPSALLERLHHDLPQVGLAQAYGMTESAAVLTWLDDEDHRRGGEVTRSAGRAVWGVGLSIQDAGGNILPAGEQGEVCARAGNLMDRYWNRPEETEEAFRGGWFHSGDMGRLDERGYLYLIDRVKDMIVTGGENVYTGEVEAVLYAHPAVREAAVFGIPDPQWGELVMAYIVLKPEQVLTADDLIVYCRRSLANYKIPRRIEFSETELPKNGSGKILKRTLRERFWASQGRAVA